MLERFLRQLLLLIEPVGFLWLCLLALLAISLVRRKWRLSVIFAALAAFVFIIGATDLPDSLLRSLERPYAAQDLKALPQTDAVIMLGGGIEPSRYEAAGFHLTRAGDRLLMAVQLMRMGKSQTLVLGGGGAELDQEVKVEAELVRAWIQDWRLVQPETGGAPEILSLGRCRDTRDEAVRVKALAVQRRWSKVLLVTSAAHLPRAEATFRAAGVEVIPVACNFLSTLSKSAPRASFGIPRYDGFWKVSVWLNEQIGWLEYRRRGWINARD